MPSIDRIHSNPTAEELHYFPGDDFETWRARFLELCRRQRWTDSVAKPLAYAYKRDLATEAVMDVPYHGPEDLTAFLDIYRTRLRRLEEVRGLWPSEGAPDQDPRGRGLTEEGPRGRLPPRPALLLEPPANVDEIRRQTLAEWTRQRQREAEDGTPAHSVEDIQNRILSERARSRPREPGEDSLLHWSGLGSLHPGSRREPDFPLGR